MARRARESLGDWAASLRFSGFTVLIMALVVFGALVISPTLTTYVQQQREIADLRASIAMHRDAVAKMDAERLKWQDPAHVRSQARGRLFYVMPGETQLSVIEDTVIPPESDEVTSSSLTEMSHNWVRELLASTLGAGVTTADPEDLLDLHAEDRPGASDADDATERQPSSESESP